MDFVIRQEGMENARRLFEAENLPGLEVAIRDAAITLKNLVMGRSPVGIGPTSGTFKSGWGNVLPVQSGGISYAVENPVDYGIILEEGLYHQVGPRTMMHGGQIYSRQAVGGVMAPLIEDEAIVQRVLDQIVARIQQEMANA
jgi:hypothetical protein